MNNQNKTDMIIDLICDRMDGVHYEPARFYYGVMNYGEIGHEITRAMDAGTNADVQAALCEYIKKQGYNTELCNYINEREWL